VLQAERRRAACTEHTPALCGKDHEKKQPHRTAILGGAFHTASHRYTAQRSVVDELSSKRKRSELRGGFGVASRFRQQKQPSGPPSARKQGRKEFAKHVLDFFFFEDCTSVQETERRHGTEDASGECQASKEA